MNFDKLIDDTFNLINNVRSSPEEFVHVYAPLLNQYQGKIFKDRIKTRQGPNAVHDLLDDLHTRRGTKDKLKWCFGLHMIADQQARKLGQNGLLTTQGNRVHVPLPERAHQFAIVKGRISEVYEFGGQSGEEVVEWLLIDDGLSSRKRRKTLLDPVFQYIGIGCCLHSTHEVITVIVLAEEVTSLVAPGKEGFYIRRQPLKQEEIKKIVNKTVKKNQRDRIQKSTINPRIINSLTPSTINQQNPNTKQVQSVFYNK